MDICYDKLNMKFIFRKIDIWLVFGFIIISLIVISRLDVESSDLYFMISHGEDILSNGFYRNVDIFSMHDLPFMYQKWLTCIVVYWLYSVIGIFGLYIVSNILILCLYCFMYFVLNKLSSNTKPINVLLLIPMFYGMLNYAVLRPHTIASFFLLWELICFEKYVNKKINNKSMYIQLFIISLCIMWFHSTMWYMCIVFLLPYLFDTKYITEGIQMNEYPIIKHVKYIAYSKKPLLFGVVIMFVASLLQPYGVNQYKYMIVCLTAVGDKCSHIGELHPLRLFSLMSVCLYIICIVIIYFMMRYKSVQLRSVYMLIGGILLTGYAVRMFFYSCLLFTIVLGNVMQQAITDEMVDEVNKKSTFMFVTILNMICMICFIVYTSVISYITIERSFVEKHHAFMGYKSVDILDYNVSNINDLKIYTDMDTGSYLLYKGGHPYIDGRAELYDITFNKTYDVLDEYYHLLLGEYKGEYVGNELTVKQFQQYYGFDYYIISKNEYENSRQDDMYELIRNTAYCNYEDDYFGIYSYVNDVKFVVF